MTHPVHKLKECDTVGAAIDKLITYRLSGLPIVNDYNEIIGFISDGDILRRIGKHKLKVIDTGFYMTHFYENSEPFEFRCDLIRHMNIMKIAKRKVVKVQSDTDIEEVSAILAHKQIKKVPVERNGVLAGIISRGDIIRHIYAEKLA
ncbi:CBS domain-containing protein [Paenibacillus sp. Soil750]|uniref:CBS domain-containing protein n=1 Tax=Paenibacillus sp. Soil750 TaxID=1736398 RepID=UPI001F3E6555|nr:CBS domain-containing protein [Paenibacillus sp. Soil750]